MLTVGPFGQVFTRQICDAVPLFLGPPGIFVDQLEPPVAPVSHVDVFDVGRVAAGVGIAAATAKHGAWLKPARQIRLETVEAPHLSLSQVMVR
jgi:hypothetical protein